MSVAAVTWALYEVRDVSPADKLALVVLAEHAAPDGTGSWPSWKRIAEVAGVSRRTVARTMDGLEKCGLIRRGDQSRSVEALRAAGKDPRWAPVVWDLVMDGSHAAGAQHGLPPVTDEDRDAHRARASQQPGRGANLAPQGVDRSSAGLPSVIAAGQRGCQSDTPAVATSDKACHPAQASGAIGDTQNQEKNQETTTNHGDDGQIAVFALDPAPLMRAGAETADALVSAVRAALPPELDAQIGTAVLRNRCSILVGRGWSGTDLSRVTKARNWNGAGAGAVVVWLTELSSGVHEVDRPLCASVHSASRPSRPPRQSQGSLENLSEPASASVRRAAMAEINRVLLRASERTEAREGSTSAADIRAPAGELEASPDKFVRS